MTKKNGQETTFVRTDVSKSSDVGNMVTKTVEKYRKLNILINDAGFAPEPLNRVVECSEEEWDRVQAINLKSTFEGFS